MMKLKRQMNSEEERLRLFKIAKENRIGRNIQKTNSKRAA